MQVLTFERDGKKIYGHLHKPQGTGPFPCVIICHGFGADLRDHEYYAQCMAAEGIAAYCFDFTGGGPEIRSDGTMYEMSVLTNKKDLLAVIDGIRKMPWCDCNNLFLMGGSQGGFVITDVSHDIPDQIRGLIPLYPAYIIHDYVRQIVPDNKNIPETIRVLGMNVSSLYAKDAYDFDIYERMDYHGPVLIIHGTADQLVPLPYSERAVRTFPQAKLVTVMKAGHGFYDEDEKTVTGLAIAFVKEHTV